MKSYLVTGSEGFIGKKLLVLLKKNNYNVKVIARSKNPNYETFECDLGREQIPSSALKSVDSVIHLAGLAHDVNWSKGKTKLYYDVNYTASIDLAKLAANNGVKSFVFVSSTKAGGAVIPGKCSDETDQYEPEGIYGKTKREAEIKLLEISKISEMNISIIRPALVYGPEMKGNLKLMLDGIHKGYFPPLPDIKNKKSLIHVDDLVRAILLLSECSCADGEIFIATDGKKYSSRDIYNAMCSALDKKIQKWSVPKFVFDLLSLISPKFRYQINKLLGDQCYSSNKIESIGFAPKKTIKEINETSF